jgi:hypothetical protein
MTESVWEELWDRLNDFYTVLISQHRASNPRLWAQVAHQETSVFPFTGYMSVCKDGPGGDEDLVLTWSVQRSNGDLLASADIAREDGVVLAETNVTKLADPVSQVSALEVQEQAI